jgi:hypothetical protein
MVDSRTGVTRMYKDYKRKGRFINLKVDDQIIQQYKNPGKILAHMLKKSYTKDPSSCKCWVFFFLFFSQRRIHIYVQLS